MSRPRGGYIGFNRVPAASAVNSAAVGVWTLREAEALKRAGTWPTAGNVVASISGLQLWLDAADSATLFDATSGGSLVAADGGVARWEDKSGNARHFTQATSGSRPLRKTSQQNGLGTLLFDGTNDWMDGSDFLDANTGGLTAFLVYKRNATGVVHELITKATTEGVGWFFRHLDTNKLQAALDLGGGTNANRATTNTVSASSYIVATWKFTAGSFTGLTFHRNGTAESMASSSGSAQTPTNTSGIVRLGAQEYLGEYYYHANANFAEVILYNSALSDTDREAVENYLLAKWNIS